MPFKENVYRALTRIPRGRVATYGQIAKIAGCPGAARAVGNAIHSNTDPDRFPCHRVVAADGSLGSNYGLGGPEAQRARLEREGVMFLDDGRVDIEEFGLVLEEHPLSPFLPGKARILFLGSFPPPRKRWSMDFFYPNWINDFWRIQGLLHFNDSGHFEIKEEKRFDKDKITVFCSESGYAFFDTARIVCRLKGNASDDYLSILQPADIRGLLDRMPDCNTIVTTGGKSAEEFLEIVREYSGYEGYSVPRTGDHISIVCFGREIKWWKMPSSSRAYPMSLAKKASFYRLI